MCNYLVTDIENNSHPKHWQYGRKKSGNFYFDRVAAIGYASNGKAKAFHFTDEGFSQFPHYLDKTDVWVGFNFAHDLLFLWDKPQVREYFARGGKIWDCQMVEYMLSGQTYTYPALRDTAVKIYGCEEREKVMEKLWKEGKLTTEIDKELVMLDVSNDVLDTEKVYLKQLDKAKSLGILQLIEDRMDALLSTTEMTWNGFHVNKQIFNEKREDLQKNLSSTILMLRSKVKKYWF
jgi:hypothetical protein